MNAVGRVLKHKLRDDWNADGTVDFQALGLTDTDLTEDEALLAETVRG